MRLDMILKMSTNFMIFPIQRYALRNYAIGASLIAFSVRLLPCPTGYIDIILDDSWRWISIKYHVGYLELYALIHIQPYAWTLTFSRGNCWVFPSCLIWDRVNPWGLYTPPRDYCGLCVKKMCCESDNLGSGYLRLFHFFDRRDIWVGSIRSMLFHLDRQFKNEGPWSIELLVIATLCIKDSASGTASPITWSRYLDIGIFWIETKSLP